jgi:hypothetical protein
MNMKINKLKIQTYHINILNMREKDREREQ